MKSRNPLSAPHISHFFKIKKAMRSQDRINRLNLMSKDILECYKIYNSKYRDDLLTDITAFGYANIKKDDIHYCYDGSSSNLEKLKLKIKNKQTGALKKTCPFCGIVSPNSFDHYLPKENFPEYSVHPLNLIPCCTTCNGKKSEYWQEDGNRAIINFYRDALPDEQFLFVDINYLNADDEIPSINFSINNDNGIPGDLYNIINKHFTRLDLCARYKEEIDKAISNIVITMISFNKSNDDAEIKEDIIKNADSLCETYGNNYWIAVTLRGLANENNFINYIKDNL